MLCISHKLFEIRSRNLSFDYIIGTDLDENFKILKENNKKNIKVKNIKEIFEKENIEIDYENSRGYSDSYKDDKYMLSLVEKKFLINSKVNKKRLQKS